MALNSLQSYVSIVKKTYSIRKKRCDLQQAYNKVTRVSQKIRVIAVGYSPNKVTENPLVGNVILYIS